MTPGKRLEDMENHHARYLIEQIERNLLRLSASDLELVLKVTHSPSSLRGLVEGIKRLANW